MSILDYSVVVFALAGLVGPVVRSVIQLPPSLDEGTAAVVGRFVYDLVFCIWPTQPLAAIADGYNLFAAFLLVVGGNVMLFVLCGVLAGAMAARRGSVPLAYVIVCVLLCLFALWGSGYNLRYLSLPPLVLSMGLYGIPFWLVATRAAKEAL